MAQDDKLAVEWYRKAAEQGVEPCAESTNCFANQKVSGAGAPKASPVVSPLAVADTELQALMSTWVTLPAAMKAGILAMVKAARG